MTTTITTNPSARRLGPLQFFTIGVALFALKFLIDRGVATFVFGRPWSILNYLIPLEGYDLWRAPMHDRLFYATMLLIAVPFVWIGIRVTLARMRDLGLPGWLVALFFVPAINLLYFTMLSVLPRPREATKHSDIPFARPARLAPIPPSDAPLLEYGKDQPTSEDRFWARVFPSSPGGSATAAVFIPVPFVAAIMFLTTQVIQSYGFGVFLAMPFALGLASAILHGYRAPRTAGQCIGVAITSLLVSGVVMILFALEGIGCLIMLLPLAIPVAIVGGLVGYSIQRPPRTGVYDSPRTLWSVGVVALLLPLGERIVSPTPTVFAVTTCIEIDAPPLRVWPQVVRFSDIPKPTDWIFRAGVAYPVRARIVGSGVGAMRYCEFSTGAFVEPIEIWDEPRLLRFAVTSSPPAMKEWSPFGDIHPPHIDGFLEARRGQFKLIALPDNRTRIEGTTWYQHSMWPESYWRLWSDHIIHRIHGRVLEHIKREAEVGEEVKR